MKNSGIHKKDCGVVDDQEMLRKFRKWKANYNESVPFYMHTGDAGAVVFEGKPELIRKLLRIYNAHKLFLNMRFVSFLNSEGIAARTASIQIADVLGYTAEIAEN